MGFHSHFSVEYAQSTDNTCEHVNFHSMGVRGKKNHKAWYNIRYYVWMHQKIKMGKCILHIISIII